MKDFERVINGEVKKIQIVCDSCLENGEKFLITGMRPVYIPPGNHGDTAGDLHG